MSETMSDPKRPNDRDGFEIAIICALPLEANAVLCSLDETWDDASQLYGRAPGDPNHYVFGRIGRHPVLVVTLPGMGIVRSASAATSLGMSFLSIRLALLVGICGAIPYRQDTQEIVLGDVIVSEVLVRLDFGRQYPTEFKRKDTIMDTPGRPNEEILSLLQYWKSDVMAQQLQVNMMKHLGNLLQHPRIGTGYPTSPDQLFAPDYTHRHHFGCIECDSSENTCDAALNASCDELGCDEYRLIPRVRRSGGDFQDCYNQQIHFGPIGTADTVMKSARHRDQIASSEKIIAFEMEGAGVWDKFNCLIIKGVCDYADSHKNKKWQTYAAASAASVAKEVLTQYVPYDRPYSHPRSQYQPPNAHLLLSLTESQRCEADTNDLTFSDMMDRVVEDFRGRVSLNQFEGYRATNLRTLKKELKRIQDEQKQVKELQNMRRIKPFLERTETLGKAVYGLLRSDEIECLIWGSTKALFQISRKHADLFDSILSAYEELGQGLPLLPETSCQFFFDYRGFQRLLAWILADLMTFHAQAIRIYSGRALKAVFKPLWKDYEIAFRKALLRIRSCKSLLEDRIKDAYINHRQVSLDMLEIRRLLQQLEKDKLDSEMEESKRQEINLNAVRDWIAAADTETVHKHICCDRISYQNSGSWILENSMVKQWIHADGSETSQAILWINGRPGSGKTYLASAIIEACLEKADCITCYFYCSEKEESRRSAIAILRGILLQLVYRHSELIPYCHAKMKSSLSSILSDLSTLNALLEAFCERLSQCYFVIDGLDECGEGRKEVLDTFKNLVKKTELLSPGKIRVAFLSQPSPKIKNSLPTAQVLALEPQHTSHDIQNYCRSRTRELAKFDYENEVLNEVAERICIRADAKLVMDNLAKQPNRRRFQDEIDVTRLPSELNEAYTRILERLKEDLSDKQLEYTTLLLGWLVCSKRPMKWTEIQAALAIDLHSTTISHELDMDLTLRDEVQELCGSLVQVLKGNRIELVHSTARLFILQQDYINLSTAECDLTLRCLRYLTLNIFREDITHSDLLKYACRGDLAFQDYAVSQWFTHMQTFVNAKEAFLEEGIMTMGTDTYSHVDLIFRELGNFVRFYGRDIPEDEPQQSTREDCLFFHPYSFHSLLLRIWNHVYCSQRGDLNQVSLKSLGNVLMRNRELLEGLSNDPEFNFSEVYDEFPFRCPKVLCFYFHEGFKSANFRNSHVNHHDLPFQCLVSNCSLYIFGFRSKSELSYHMKTYHPEECDFEESFAPSNRREVVATDYKCQICGTFFARKYILQDHNNAVHTGLKPYCCLECGRSFVRKNDLTRHEKIHERNRQ